ncbi:MAG: cell wall hydrolase, partial [Clostridia bacterium]|nr:cell wall hydrolase [Clostridia bacterium]
MTKTKAELYGSFSAYLAGLIVVLAVWFSPLYLPSFEGSALLSTGSSSNAAPSANAESSLQGVLSPEQDADHTEFAPSAIVLPDRFVSDPTLISGHNKASLTASLYGVTAEDHRPEELPETLSSMVLAHHLPKQELGLFHVTYRPTPEEYRMLLFCVEFETRTGCLEHKSLIAQVILNRVQGEKFPFTIAEVLTAPGQFDVMPGYADCTDWEPSEVTRRAVDQVLSGISPDY